MALNFEPAKAIQAEELNQAIQENKFNFCSGPDAFHSQVKDKPVKLELRIIFSASLAVELLIFSSSLFFLK